MTALMSRRVKLQSLIAKIILEKLYTPNIRVIQTKVLQPAGTWGISKANGDLIAFLDSDDCWLPEKLQNQVQILNEHRDVGVLCEASKYWFSWEKANQHDIVVKVGASEGKYFPPQLIYQLYPLGKGAAPCPSGMIMKKSSLDKIDGFEETFTGANQVYEDQAFLCKIYLNETVFVSDDANNLYRQRSGSLMQSISQKHQYFRVRSYFLKWMDKYLLQHGINDARINKLMRKAKYQSANPGLYLFFKNIKRRFLKLFNK